MQIGRRAARTSLVVVMALLVAVATLAASGSAAHTASPGARLGAVGHAGRWLTDRQGRVVLLHGVNVVAKGSRTPAQEGFGSEDAAWLAANGFDVVRLGLSPSALMPGPGVIDAAYLDSFAATVRDLTGHGLYVLLDIHQDCWGPTTSGNGFPDWMTLTHGAENTHTGFPLCYITNPAISAAFESFWHDEPGPGGTGLQDSFGAMWSALAAAVGSDPGVLGYDLLNEPWPGSGWGPCLNGPDGCPDLDRAELDPFGARMTAAIRAHDPRHLVFTEPFVLFNFGLAPTSVAAPGGAAGGGLSFHMYPFSPADEPKVIANAIAWGTTRGAPVLNTEFSIVLGPPNPVDADRQVSELDAAFVPWIWWDYGSVVRDLALPPEGTNVNTPIADQLGRPHPVAVAGTPAWSVYDSTTRSMVFAYATAGPAGARLRPGASTVFSVPRRAYPDGWRASVAGGRILGPRDRATLRVGADPGAPYVVVIVTPRTRPAGAP